jgi:hypothetical protein
MRVWPLDPMQAGVYEFRVCALPALKLEIDPNQNYTLKYRMIVFDGKMDAATAEKYWNSFAVILN